MARLEIDRIVVTLGGQRVLHEVSLDVAEGECVALLGPSGCGKTTTLRAIAGFVAVDSGQIRVAGQSVLGLPPHRRNLGLVFQDYALFPHMTVAGNVGYGLRMRGLDRRAIASRVEEALALVQLEGMGGRHPSQMSGGQRQRVALARALVIRPDILLLDEPLGALDRKLRDTMQVELKRIRRDVGITTIIVTHDQEEALSLADRVAVMFGGRILEVDRPADLYERPGTRDVMDFLGDANLVDAEVAGTPAMLALPGGLVLPLPDGASARPRRLRVGFRPEHVAVLPETAAGDGVMAATVAEIVYKGAHLEVHAAAADGTPYRARLGAAEAAWIVPGRRIGLRPDPSRLVLFEEERR